MGDINPVDTKIQTPPLFFRKHTGWGDTGGIIETITSLIETEHGLIIIYFEQLADIDIRVFDDIEEVEALLYRDDLCEAILKLYPGKYRLARSLSGKWEFDLDDTIPDMEPEDFDAEIDPVEFSHCHDLNLMSINDFTVEDRGHGLGIATRHSGEKFFLKSTGRKPKDLFIKEVTALHHLSHPNIVALKGCLLDDNGKIIGLLTELSESGDLYRHGGSPVQLKVEWVLQVVDALQYIKREGIEYNDVKRSNIVIIEEQAKLIDFDGGYSTGHFKEDLESFGLAVLLENLEVPGVDKLVKDAKTTAMPLNTFRRRLASVHLSA